MLRTGIIRLGFDITMSRLLSELLGAEEPLFTVAISQLEKVAANPSSDVHLSAEIIGKCQIKTRELGLDPKDTTGKELYFALLAQAERHNERLTQVLGASHSEDIASLAPLIVRRLSSLNINHSAWLLKKAVAKEILKANPPKLLMKHLHYKSVASMIKNEPVQELFLGAAILEGPTWRKTKEKAYKKLKPSDFEMRPIELICLRPDRWTENSVGYMSGSHHCVITSIELGAVGLMPVAGGRQKAAALVNLPMIIHAINEIRIHSSFFKLRQLDSKGFSTSVVNALKTGPASSATVAGQKIQWRIIHHYFSEQSTQDSAELFEPHIQSEDLRWRHAEDIMAELDPELGWWQDIGYVGVLWGGQPVSFNLFDVAYNYGLNVPLELRQSYYFKEALWDEILMRYLGERPVQQKIMSQLDSFIFSPEFLASNSPDKII